MKTQRKFCPEIRLQVIEELLCGVSSPAQVVGSDLHTGTGMSLAKTIFSAPTPSLLQYFS
jgi:hypothetical protein